MPLKWDTSNNSFNFDSPDGETFESFVLGPPHVLLFLDYITSCTHRRNWDASRLSTLVDFAGPIVTLSVKLKSFVRWGPRTRIFKLKTCMNSLQCRQQSSIGDSRSVYIRPYHWPVTTVGNLWSVALFNVGLKPCEAFKAALPSITKVRKMTGTEVCKRMQRRVTFLIPNVREYHQAG